MNFSEFSELVSAAKKNNPIWFGIDPDKIATDIEISAFEKKINAALPSQYTEFVKNYGGGYFALGIIYSLDLDSPFSIQTANTKYARILKNHVIFSDNGSGDFYGFEIIKNQCTAKIKFWDHETALWLDTEYSDIFELLKKIALSN